jgi:hypothetical protein
MDAFRIASTRLAWAARTSGAGSGGAVAKGLSSGVSPSAIPKKEKQQVHPIQRTRIGFLMGASVVKVH